MKMIDNKTKEIQSAHKLTYLNNIYKMKEQLTTFENRKATLADKIAQLAQDVDRNLSHTKRNMLESCDVQKVEF